MKSLRTIFLRISPGRFHYLKFILEGYDNLAVLSSYDNQQGIILLRFSDEVACELFALLASIAAVLQGKKEI